MALKLEWRLNYSKYGTLFPIGVQKRFSVRVHSFLLVNNGEKRVKGYTLSCQYNLG